MRNIVLYLLLSTLFIWSAYQLFNVDEQVTPSPPKWDKAFQKVKIESPLVSHLQLA